MKKDKRQPIELIQKFLIKPAFGPISCNKQIIIIIKLYKSIANKSFFEKLAIE